MLAARPYPFERTLKRVCPYATVLRASHWIRFRVLTTLERRRARVADPACSRAFALILLNLKLKIKSFTPSVFIYTFILSFAPYVVTVAVFVCLCSAPGVRAGAGRDRDVFARSPAFPFPHTTQASRHVSESPACAGPRVQSPATPDLRRRALI